MNDTASTSLPDMDRTELIRPKKELGGGKPIAVRTSGDRPIAELTGIGMLLPPKACGVAEVVCDDKGGVEGLEVKHNDRVNVHSALGLQDQREGLEGRLPAHLLGGRGEGQDEQERLQGRRGSTFLGGETGEGVESRK